MDEEVKLMVRIAKWGATIVLLSIAALMYGCPHYNVWQQELSGRAEFARAEQNRRIKVEEAKASLESAKLNAQAEIERAKGAAQANKELIEGLGGPENYLRWRYIMMLESNDSKGVQREVIYTPAGGMFPITEAGRAVTPAQQPTQR
jgi:regulator of protease activity HflC (stomatin/prohibitin superfamily)